MTELLKQMVDALRHIENAATDPRVQRYEIRAAATEALAKLDAQAAEQAAGGGEEVPEHLPTKEHIRELAQEAMYQVMEQAQVFASAWSLVGGRFDTGNALSEAEEAKAELRTMVRSLADLAAETVRPAPARAQPLSDAEIDALRSDLAGYVRVSSELATENEALRRDAERYRFIRDADRSESISHELGVYAMESLDEYVDAAMEGEATLAARGEKRQAPAQPIGGA